MISLVYDPELQRCDFVRTGGANLDTDEGLQSAVTASLLSDARAKDSDDIDEGADKRGWWGQIHLDQPKRPFGSRLWLLKRAKLTNATMLLASEYVREALLWMVDARIASEVKANTTRMAGRNDTGITAITIQRPSKTKPRFETVWEVQFGL